MILKQYNANFVTYELDPGNYAIEDLQNAVYPLGDHEGTLHIESDDSNNKTKLILTRLGSTFGTLRFDEKSFYHTLIGFTPFWDYKPTNAIHADSNGVHSNNTLNLNTIKKIHLKCYVIDGSVVNCLRQPILYSFVLDKPSGYKVFCEPETINYKKNKKKSVLNTITFYLEDDNNEEVDFNGETLTFTLQMIKT